MPGDRWPLCIDDTGHDTGHGTAVCRLCDCNCNCIHARTSGLQGPDSGGWDRFQRSSPSPWLRLALPVEFCCLSSPRCETPGRRSRHSTKVLTRWPPSRMWPRPASGVPRPSSHRQRPAVARKRPARRHSFTWPLTCATIVDGAARRRAQRARHVVPVGPHGDV